MTTDSCELLSERMPLVAEGRADWSEADARHLVDCRDCSAEWRLFQAARRLGDAAARRIDSERLSGAVLAGVAARRRATRWRRSAFVAGLAVAAAAALVVWLGDPGQSGRLTDPGNTLAAEDSRLPLAELDPLDESGLQQVLEQLDRPLAEGGAGSVPTFGQLDEIQLERVLRSLEG